ncbi:MAG: HU family DNA-binding protein [Paramuribaculum sp.]|nr:HU family DNA-binding protein [Paramuribaculum sp.]
MNQKIPLTLLAEKMASENNISAEEAENIIKTTFNLVGKALINEHIVDFPGLGKFIRQTSSETPIKFIPSDNWASTVNAPFSMFSSVPLPDHIDSSDLETLTEVGTDHLPNSVSSYSAQEPVIKQEEEPAITEDAKEELEPAENAIHITESEISHDEAPVNILEESITPDINTNVEQSNHRVEIVPVESIEEPTFQSVEKNDNFAKGFIIGLIIGLAIGAMALCCYVIYYVNSNHETTNIETELDESYIPEAAY